MNDFSMPDTPSRKSLGFGAAAGLCAVLCVGAHAAPPGASIPGALIPGAASRVSEAAPGAPTGVAPAVPAPIPAALGQPGEPPATAADQGPGPALPPLALPGPTGQAPAAATEDGPRLRDSLDPDLVYAVMVAELAARRGDLAMAFTHYLRAAQLARDPKMAELAVRAAASSGDDAGAARAAALWLTIAPDSPGAHQIAAVLRIKAGDQEGALDQLARVVALAGDAESGYLQAAGIVGRAVSAPERVALMQALAARDATNPEAQQALAMLAASVEQYEVAAAAAERALELRPGWDKPRLFLVKLLLIQGKRSEARALIERDLAAQPDDWALRLLYAQFLVEEKDYAAARTVYARLLADRPQEAEALFAAGILSLELEDLEAARGYLTRLYQTGQRRDEASFYLGQVEERAAQPAAAIDWYGKSQGANLMDARIRTAVLRAKAGEIERAREIIQQLRDQAPDEAPTLFLAEAEILDQVGRQDAAMQVYAAAIAAFPDDLDLLYGRAMYEVKLEQIPQAEQDLRRIIEHAPDHADALNALGYTLADRTDRYEEALGYIERAYQLKPTEPAILDSAGWVNYKLGRHEEALTYLRKANDAMKDGEIAAHLGEVLWALGREAEAQAVWDAALKDHPDHPYLLKVIGRHSVSGADATAAPSPPPPETIPATLPETPHLTGSETRP